MPTPQHIPQVGVLDAIFLSPARQAPLLRPAEAEAIEAHGLRGDHRAAGRPGRKRQVTLIQREDLAVIAALMGREGVDPALLRRNLVVSGLPLAAIGKGRVQIGEVLLELTGPCDPCHRVEAALGPGGEAAAWGHCGFTARVLRGGALRVGEAARALPAAPAA
jgi:MOSC domain-containing protein YiiM